MTDDLIKTLADRVDQQLDATKAHEIVARMAAAQQMYEQTEDMTHDHIVGIPCPAGMLLGMSLLCQMGLAVMGSRGKE